MEFIGVGNIKSEPVEEEVETPHEFEDESFQNECLDIKTEVGDEVFDALVTLYEPSYEYDQVKDETSSENGEEEFREESKVEENCETHGEFVLEDSARQEEYFREESMDSLESSQESEHSDWSQQEELNADWPSDRKRRKISKNTSLKRKQTFASGSSADFGTHFLTVTEEMAAAAESSDSQESPTRYNLRGIKRKRTPLQINPPPSSATSQSSSKAQNSSNSKSSTKSALSSRTTNKLELDRISKQYSTHSNVPTSNNTSLNNNPNIQSVNTPKFLCDFCGDVLNDQFVLILHINEKHSDKCIVKNDQLQIAINAVKAKMELVKSDVNKVEKSIDNKVEALDKLKEQYIQKEIKASELSTLPPVKKKYKCGICLSVFMTLELLFQHFNGHSKEERMRSKVQALKETAKCTISKKTSELVDLLPLPTLTKLQMDIEPKMGERIMIQTVSEGQPQLGTYRNLILTRDLLQGQGTTKAPARMILLSPPTQPNPVPVAPSSSDETIIGTPLDEPTLCQTSPPKSPSSSELIIGTPIDFIATNKEVNSPMHETPPVMSQIDPLEDIPVLKRDIKNTFLIVTNNGTNFRKIAINSSNSQFSNTKMKTGGESVLKSSNKCYANRNNVPLSSLDATSSINSSVENDVTSKVTSVPLARLLPPVPSEIIPDVPSSPNVMASTVKVTPVETNITSVTSNVTSVPLARLLPPVPSEIIPDVPSSPNVMASTVKVTPVETNITFVTSKVTSVPLARLLPPVPSEVIPDLLSTPKVTASTVKVTPVETNITFATSKVTSVPLARLLSPVKQQVIPDVPSTPLTVENISENSHLNSPSEKNISSGKSPQIKSTKTSSKTNSTSLLPPFTRKMATLYWRLLEARRLERLATLELHTSKLRKTIVFKKKHLESQLKAKIKKLIAKKGPPAQFVIPE